MSSEITKYNIQSKTNAVPYVYLAYWKAELVPAECDFYGDFTVSTIALRIFQDLSLVAKRPDNGVKYQIQAAEIIAASDTKIIKIGLHLFPILRFKKAVFPYEIDLHIKTNDGSKISIELPEKLKKNLLIYLNEGRPNTEFTCIEFTHFLNGVYSTEYDSLHALSKYNFCFYNKENLSPGCTILLRNQQGDFIHAAIYLRDDLYLWHSGGTCLRVSTLEDLKLCYSSKDILIAKLKDRIKFYLDPNKRPVNITPYWKDNLQVPPDLDFYGDITVQKISLEVFQNRSFPISNRDNDAKYKVPQAVVIAETVGSIYKMGLHLFPIFRFNKKEFPDELTLYMKNDQGNKIPIELPQTMKAQLLRYLNEGKPTQIFSGPQFVDFLYGVYRSESIDGCYFDKYILLPFDESLLRPGTAVVFYDEKQNPCQTAIYLQDDLYLWHAGHTCLRISSYEDLMLCYGAKNADILLLKKGPSVHGASSEIERQ